MQQKFHGHGQVQTNNIVEIAWVSIIWILEINGVILLKIKGLELLPKRFLHTRLACFLARHKYKRCIIYRIKEESAPLLTSLATNPILSGFFFAKEK